jgi:hypothetical protein
MRLFAVATATAATSVATTAATTSVATTSPSSLNLSNVKKNSSQRHNISRQAMLLSKFNHGTLIKKKIKFSSYLRKFRMEQLQSHI